MKYMKNKFPRAVMGIALLAAAGLFSFSYAQAASTAPVAKVADYLVNAAGEQVDGAALAEKPYVLFYYSAHWCPPCRKFTPKLVEFYNTHKGGEAFEIVFVSSDHSEKDMLNYMKEVKMPWLAVSYDKIEATEIKSYGGPYIPSLVMFDKEGKLMAAAYDSEKEEYVGPDFVLDTLLERL